MEPIIPDNFFGEQYSEDVALIFKPKEILLSQKTKFQKVDIINTKTYGKILFLDDLLMRTDKDGYIITEMITHISMLTGNTKKKVLIVGGGEGFTVTELLKYPEIEKIDVIDIDSEFVKIAKEFYPEKAKAFDDPKVTLHEVDGLEFMKNTNETYDVIFVTSTDPSGLSAPLFTEEFYKLCNEKLTQEGIFMTDAYMPFYDLGYIDYKYLYNAISKHYPITKIYNCTIPTFPGGLFSFVIGSKKHDPESEFRENPSLETNYYNSKIHKASFALPEFMVENLGKK